MNELFGPPMSVLAVVLPAALGADHRAGDRLRRGARREVLPGPAGFSCPAGRAALRVMR